MRTSLALICCFALASCGAGEPQVRNQQANPTSTPRAAEPEPRNDAEPARAEPTRAPAHPCLVQDGEAVTHRLKALGTEPFWAAEVEGRCVTYKTPENQAGTRIWTHVDVGPQGPAWNGALNGRQFQLYVKPSTGCSDGMSDRVYPLDAVLRVEGETRRGCAERL